MATKKSASLTYPYEGNSLIARITFSDGSESKLLVSKPHALETADHFLGIGLTKREWKALRKEIEESGLLPIQTMFEDAVFTLETHLSVLGREIDRLQLEIHNEDNDNEGDTWKKP